MALDLYSRIFVASVGLKKWLGKINNKRKTIHPYLKKKKKGIKPKNPVPTVSNLNPI